MKTQSKYYRKDIDGLRAIAILSVLIFHLTPHLLPAGYLGVDVFFVVSGFLITSIIVRELDGGSFTFLGFYIRRLLRLFPALLAMIFTVIAAGYFWLLPDEFEALGKHIQGASLFISNFTLLGEVGYFNVASSKKILLHLWSLAIEEQFYLICPFFISIFYRLKFSSSLNFALAICMFASLFCFGYYLSFDPDYAFYMPNARFWQILSGCVLALVPARIEKRGLADILAAAALLVIISIFFMTPESVPARFFATLFVSIGTLCILVAGASRINTGLLSVKPLVYLGLISYPLYLWHWPIIVFNRISTYGDSLSPSSYALEIIMSFTFAIATFHLLEVPLMKLKGHLKTTVAISLLSAMILSGLIGHNIMNGRLKPAAVDPAYSMLSSAKSNWQYPDSANFILKANVEVETEKVPIFKLGHNSSETLFLGDSNMEQYYPRFVKLTGNKTLNSAVFITGGGCLPIPEITNSTYKYCANVIEKSVLYAKSSHVKAIVVAAQWQNYFLKNSSAYFYQTRSNTLESKSLWSQVFYLFTEYIKEIGQNKKIYIVLNIPIHEKFDPLYMIDRNFPFGKMQISQPPFERAEFDLQMKIVNEGLKAVAAATGAEVIDPMDYLCDKINCETHRAGTPIYKDFSHLAATYVMENVKFLDKTVSGN